MLHSDHITKTHCLLYCNDLLNGSSTVAHCASVSSSIFVQYLHARCIKQQISSSVHLYSTRETLSNKSKCKDYSSERKEPEESNNKASDTLCFLLVFWFIIRACGGLGESCPLIKQEKIHLSPRYINDFCTVKRRNRTRSRGRKYSRFKVLLKHVVITVLLKQYAGVLFVKSSGHG